MACQVNISEAKARLSELLDRALAGEEVVVARAGRPMARLAPMAAPKQRKPGAWRGWGASVPTEVFLAPIDPEDLDAAEGKLSDDFGISLPPSGLLREGSGILPVTIDHWPRPRCQVRIETRGIG